MCQSNRLLDLRQPPYRPTLASLAVIYPKSFGDQAIDKQGNEASTLLEGRLVDSHATK